MMLDTRHNLNLTTTANPFVSEPVPTGIDLNRNYDHFWDDCSPSDPFAPGGGHLVNQKPVRMRIT